MTEQPAGDSEVQVERFSQRLGEAAFGLNERSSSGSSLNWRGIAQSLTWDGDGDEPPGFKWQAFDLARLWHGLGSGEWRFKEVFDSASRCFAVLERVDTTKAKPIRRRCLDILGRVLLGQSHKVVAFELQVACSTVASAAQEGMRAMGLKRRGSRAPLLLAMAACAALRPGRTPVLAQLTRLGQHARDFFLVSMPRPDMHFPVRLSYGEAEVLRLLIGGATHAQIAKQRATSCRTVANQLATTFRKLGVSGRGALTAYLILHRPEFSEGLRSVPRSEAHSDFWLGSGVVEGNGSSQPPSGTRGSSDEAAAAAATDLLPAVRSS